MNNPSIRQSKPSNVSIRVIAIRFDGGTSCNKPRKGYGNGYGSYQINDGKVVRLKFGVPMSNNVAEISTLISAVNSLTADYKVTRLHIYGDSRIALDWAYRAGNRIAYKPPKHGRHAPEFFNALMSLYEALKGFAEVKTEWEPRSKNRQVFGH
jgi:ribonuclease HI